MITTNHDGFIGQFVDLAKNRYVAVCDKQLCI